MNYQVRVTLAGLKGFFRVYSLNGANTLYAFHKQLRSDLEFPMDQPILFKALDAQGNVVARWALTDLGSGTVDDVRISDVLNQGVASMVYFYDIASRKSVIVTFEGESPELSSVPILLESKGPIPLEFENGYVAFEDMPKEHRRIPPLGGGILDVLGSDDDDDDEDEEEEDSDKEEEDIIYDASE